LILLIEHEEWKEIKLRFVESYRLIYYCIVLLQKELYNCRNTKFAKKHFRIQISRWVNFIIFWIDRW